jgi:hypothetical protein
MLIRSQRRFDAERNRAASFPSPLVHSAIGRPVHASLPAAHRTLGLPALAAA